MNQIQINITIIGITFITTISALVYIATKQVGKNHATFVREPDNSHASYSNSENDEYENRDTFDPEVINLSLAHKITRNYTKSLRRPAKKIRGGTCKYCK